MDAQLPVIVLIDVSRIKAAVKGHHSHIFSTDTTYGEDLSDVLQTLAHVVKYGESGHSKEAIIEGIVDSMELYHDEYWGYLTLLQESLPMLYRGLEEVIRRYPEREPLLIELDGNSAHFKLE